jgi:hypothetical protein
MLACALLACLLRLADYPRAGGVASSLCLIFASLGQLAAHRRQRPALPSPRPHPNGQPATAGDAS